MVHPTETSEDSASSLESIISELSDSKHGNNREIQKLTRNPHNDKQDDAYSTSGKISSPYEDDDKNDAKSIFSTYSKRLLRRTSTVLDAIRDDNEYVMSQEKGKINPDLGDNLLYNNGEIPCSDKQITSSELEGVKTKQESSEDDITRTQTSQSLAYDGEYNIQDIIDRPPDGTVTGWISLICVTFINTFSWGANTSYGVLMSYYMESNHFPGATKEDYALIGGLNLGLSFIACSLSNSLVRRFYYKHIMYLGSALVFICYFVAAEVKTIVQLIIVQGLILSIAYALAAAPSMVVIPSWFLERRSFANGISSGGAGLAGLIFSRPVQAVIDSTGSYKWALRMVGIICGVMLFVSIFLVRCRRKFQVTSDIPIWKEIFQNIVNWRIYKMPPIIYLIIWNFIYGIGYAILLFSMSSYGRTIGLTSSQGSLVTTLQSAAQMIGRPALGYISFLFGKINVTIIFTLLLGILSLAYWVFIKSYGPLIGFGIIAGFIMGVNWVNFVPMCSDVVGGGDDLLAALSALYLTGGPPMIVSEIIGLKLEQPNSSSPFFHPQILVGVTCIVGALCLLPFREWKISRMLTARSHLIEKRAMKDRQPGDMDRLKRYELLLHPGLKGYILRVFYPIKA